MSPVEDQIRSALRSEAGRMREMPSLHLHQAPHRIGPVTAPRHTRRSWTWLAPVTAAALVIVLAAALAIVRTILTGPAFPVAPQPPAPTTFPRYYVALEQVNNDGNAARLVVGDSVTGKTLATFNAPAGATFEGSTPAGAADDRTFVVAQTLGQRKPPYPPWATDGPTAWYLIRLSPGSATQVTMTRLAIKSSASDLPITETVLSADGRYIAAASGDAGTQRVDLRVYSVVSGQRVHAWTMVNAPASAFNYTIPSDLSWVNGDDTVKFTLSQNSYAQVRTVTVTGSGTGLLAASHVAWSQYAPFPPHGVYTPSTPTACGQTILTADGQNVLCSRTPSFGTGTLPAVEWLEYPISSTTKSRVIARIPPPVAKLSPNGIVSLGSMTVYVSPSEVMGYFYVVHKGETGPLTIREFIASGGTIRQLGTGTIPLSAHVVW